jgi:endoglucanase
MLKQKVSDTKFKIATLMSLSPLAMACLALLISFCSTPSNASVYTATGSSPLGSNIVNTDILLKPNQVSSPAVTPSSTQPSPQATTTNKPVVSISAAPSINRNLALYTWPNSHIATSATAWANSSPVDANKMLRLASTPMAIWFTGAINDISNASSYVAAATAVNQVPVLVAYNIPERDCGSYSAGGASSPAAYESWINSMAAAIGHRQSIVIVEPDAIAGLDCLSSAEQQTRLQLINYAVQTLRSQTSAAIYLDAGNSSWQPASLMSGRLQSAGISQATGFSLNVSNFQTSASNVSYGENLSGMLGGKHFIIDTSRNGNGPTSDDAWCNPDGRAFGQTPTMQTGISLLDGYLWIKNPGESDGPCGPSQDGVSAPLSGVWWPQYVLMLANNAGW